MGTAFKRKPNPGYKIEWVTDVNQQNPHPTERVTFLSDSTGIACLDVSPSGRILSTCSVARALLKSCEDEFIKHLFPEPDQAFVDALKTASSASSPRASVLRCIDKSRRAVIQVNVIPFKSERVRIVLFLPAQVNESITHSPVKLTERERAVLELSASGLRRDRIGYLLGIALPTVDMHCRNIRKKFGASTMAAAVAIAAKSEPLAN